jgi:hypothetical protein
MTLFEFVKLVLDELYTEGAQEYGNQLDVVINKRIDYLKEKFENLVLENRESIDYRDPATRFAYVYKYVTAHGEYLAQILKMIRKETGRNIFKGDTLRLSCVGGGPGSDVIGTLKYLKEYTDEPVRKMTCLLLDGEEAWHDTWIEIDEKIDEKIELKTIVIVPFQHLDVRDRKSWSGQRKKFLKSKLFTLSYFVSEVCSLDDGTITAFWKKIFDDSDSGAIFVYLDNGHEIFDKYFDSQWQIRSDLDCVLRGDKIQIKLRHSEEKKVLGRYLDKFGPPKIQSWISYRVLQKR